MPVNTFETAQINKDGVLLSGGMQLSGSGSYAIIQQDTIAFLFNAHRNGARILCNRARYIPLDSEFYQMVESRGIQHLMLYSDEIKRWYLAS